MGSIPPELSLDCRPTFIPTSITDFLKQLSSIRNVPDKLFQIDEYISRLEDEMRKIDAFKRELPLSVLLVKDAIVALRAESVQYKKSRTEPVLEEFIPLKKSSNEDNKAEVTKDKDNSREKMSWMSSVQLWNGDQNTDEASNKQQSKSELKIRSPEEGNSSVTEDRFQSCKTLNMGKAFSPFKGYSGFSVTTVRKDDKDELPGVPGLSLHTPGIIKLREETSGLNSKHNGSRGGLSSVASSQSNIRNGSLSQQQAARKQRRCWSPELHRRFVDALQQLGGSQVATPKQIRELMQVDGLTNDEVKSHLQKYRLHTRRIPNTQTQPANQSGVALWMSQDQYGGSSKQSSSQSGSPQGPLHLSGSSRGTSTTVGDSMEEEDDVKSESQSWKNHAHMSGKIDV
ncbi:transcription factor HHO6-like [Nicotiana tabacum]|uniref:Transcription factor HHO6-like n=2 Tax=Nicotiana TaxID=4085 RepID=A0A1S3XVJ9_TOBAC|nr:PREDICTED: two-component response regulator-like APRR2 [Nicotiana sylvestris]XP_016443900.1 PREDICTED: two-component response regulator-like APRR2 [Nicotiana tabacum]